MQTHGARISHGSCETSERHSQEILPTGLQPPLPQHLQELGDLTAEPVIADRANAFILCDLNPEAA